jgi:hypothetical protein
MIILGHAHHQGVWQRRGRTVINTGSFRFPGQPRVVRITGSQVSVHRIFQVDGCFVPEEQALYEHRLGGERQEESIPHQQPELQPLGISMRTEAA